MDFCPGRFTPSQLHGHPGRCAWHVVPKPCFGLRSDPLGQKLHRLGPLGTGCFPRKSASQPTRCLRLAQRRVHHPHRRGQGVPIRGESLILWSNQIRVEGVRLLSCWVHKLTNRFSVIYVQFSRKIASLVFSVLVLTKICLGVHFGVRNSCLGGTKK